MYYSQQAIQESRMLITPSFNQPKSSNSAAQNNKFWVEPTNIAGATTAGTPTPFNHIKLENEKRPSNHLGGDSKQEKRVPLSSPIISAKEKELAEKKTQLFDRLNKGWERIEKTREGKLSDPRWPLDKLEGFFIELLLEYQAVCDQLRAMEQITTLAPR